ncbi:MAG TPA: hypothetical protein VFU15_14295 [Bacteroidia bacterium]|nr:hypothetical protein [Bacteroidia bacterium]
MRNYFLIVVPVLAICCIFSGQGILRFIEKSQTISSNAILSTSYDDDSISATAADDDGDDVSETLFRLLPVSLVAVFVYLFLHSVPQASFSLLPHGAPKQVSPVFLGVFRI